MTKELRALKEQLDHGMRPLQLAEALGYKSRMTLHQWFKKKKIPRLALQRVQLYLKEKR